MTWRSSSTRRSFALELRLHFGYFVEKNGAAVRLLEDPFPPLDGARERPRLMSEQPAFDQALTERGTIPSNNASTATGEVMNLVCRYFFAHATFAGDEDRCVRRRDFGDRSRSWRIACDRPTNIGRKHQSLCHSRARRDLESRTLTLSQF
jgi:hypothetical protein